MIGKCMINKYPKNKSRPRDFTRLSEINKNEVNILSCNYKIVQKTLEKEYQSKNFTLLKLF
jgi:hypothetical protein